MANGHGGAREGSGRKRRPAYVPDGKLTPLDYMISVMRNKRTPRALKMEAAKAAAPYCHARLQSTELAIDADLTIQLVSYLDNHSDTEPDAA